MKQLAKNQQFRVGFLTWFFVYRTRLRVKTVPWSLRTGIQESDLVLLIVWELQVEGLYTQPLPIGSFFGKERFAQHCFVPKLV
jgi:hypothetical protein